MSTTSSASSASRSSSTSVTPTRSSAGLEPGAPRERPDHDGRALRRRAIAAVSTTRSARSGTSLSTTCFSPRGGRDGGARSERPSTTRLPPARAVVARTRALRPRPVHRLPLDAGRRPRLDDRDVRRARTADRQRALARRAVLRPHREALPVTQTEVRLIFRDASPLTFLARAKPAAGKRTRRPDRPETGSGVMLEAHRADATGPSRSRSTWSSPTGRGGPDPVRDPLRGRTRG